MGAFALPDQKETELIFEFEKVSEISMPGLRCVVSSEKHQICMLRPYVPIGLLLDPLSSQLYSRSDIVSNKRSHNEQD
jgi:hypothetical protein